MVVTQPGEPLGGRDGAVGGNAADDDLPPGIGCAGAELLGD
jgi:hypothetical protein